MSLTTYKPIFLYVFTLVVLGIAASVFQSTVLARASIGGYLIGWAMFLWSASRFKKQ